MSCTLPTLLHLLGSFLFLLLFGLHCLYFTSLLSVVFPFGSPDVSFLLFAVCSGLLHLRSILRFPLFAAVALPCTSSRFPVSLLACSLLFCVVFLAFLQFLPHFVSFCLLFVCLYIWLSLCWFVSFCIFTSVSSSFSPVRLLRLGFRTPYSLVSCSDFSSPPVAVLFWIFALPFFFLCFSSLSAFLQEFALPFTGIFLAYPSFCFIGLCVVPCGSPFSSTPFGSFALASGLCCLPCSSFASVVNFLVGFYLLSSFRLRFFLLRVSIVFPCWCARIVFYCSPSLAVMLFLFFSFPFVFIGLTYGVCLLLSSFWLHV